MSGAIAGYLGNSDAVGTIENCWNSGELTCSERGDIFAHLDAANITNCWNLDTLTASARENVSTFTAEELANGALAYKLGTPWGQTIGTNNHPVLNGKAVYYGYLSCATDAEAVYTNDSTASAEKPAHTGGTATCTDKAVCTVCGESYGELLTHVDSADDGDHVCDYGCGAVLEEHTGGTATCTDKAVCTVCGESYGETNPDNHEFVNYEKSAEASCGVNAKETAKCENCEVTDTREISNTALEHSFSKYEEVEAPKCGVAGKEVAVCDNNCGTTDEKEIPALTHSFTKYEEVIAPECGKAGLEMATCDNGCGTTDEREITALEHEIVTVEAQVKTCTTIGWNAYEYCTECDYTTYVEIPASHEIKTVDKKDATCTEAGHEAYEYCTECDYTTYKEIPVIAHTEETVKGYAATCTQTGLTDGVKCSVCKETLTAQEVIPVIPHTEETVKGYEATCTETGLTDGVKCSVCKETLTAQQTIAMLAHKDDNGDYLCDYGCGHEFEKPAEPDTPDVPDTPDEPTDGTCDHLCHKDGILGFFWKIISFLQRLFGIQQYCDCGALHYEKAIFG